MNTGLRGNREKKYSDAEIKHYYQRLGAAAMRNKIRFSTCYIGNGAKDYYQHQSLWANKADCCDVVGNVGSFKTSAQSIAWATRAKHTSNAELVKKSEQEEIQLDRLFLNSQVETKSPLLQGPEL
jgi:hypothetical protein